MKLFTRRLEFRQKTCKRAESKNEVNHLRNKKIIMTFNFQMFSIVHSYTVFMVLKFRRTTRPKFKVPKFKGSIFEFGSWSCA